MKHQEYLGIQFEKNSQELEELKRKGFFVKENLLSKEYIDELRVEMDKIWESQLKTYGENLLKKIGDWGQVRGMMKESNSFLNLIINKNIHEYVDQILGPTCILHLQNGIVLHPSKKHNQSKYHKDFPKDFISSKIISLNTFIAVDEFTKENGGTYLIPGSHKIIEKPSESYIEKNKIQIECQEGAIIFFDSNLWHAGGINKTKKIRRAINMQWTKPFIKQQMDYPEFMKDIVDIDSKLAQKLGMWTIPPKSVKQYRVLDPSMRTYKSGQG